MPEQTFKERRLEQELLKLSDDDLIRAIQEARIEAIACTDETEWILIRDTVLVIGAELKRRGK